MKKTLGISIFILLVLSPAIFAADPAPAAATQVTASTATATVTATTAATDAPVIVPLPVPLPKPSFNQANYQAIQGSTSLEIKVKGENLVLNSRIESKGEGLRVNSGAVTSPSELVLNITADINAKPEPKEIVVTTPDNVSASFYINIKPRPIVTQGDLKVLQGSNSFEIKAAGANLIKDSKAEVKGDGVIINSAVVASDTELALNVTVDPNAKIGARDIILTSPSGIAASFKINIAPKPAFLQGSYNVVQGAQYFEIKAKGANLIKDSKVDIKAEDVKLNSSFVTSAVDFVMNISVEPDAVVGTREVIVTSPEGVPAAFSITIVPRPTISSLLPNNFFVGAGTRTLSVTGANFNKGITGVFSSPAIMVNSIEIKSPKELSVTIFISEKIPSCGYDFTLTNTDNGSDTLKNSMCVNPRPVISKVVPASATQGVFEQDMEVQGEGFTKESTVKISGEGIIVKSTDFVSAKLIKIKVTVGANAEMEERDVVVANPDGGSYGARECIGINRVDKESIYYGDLNRFKKPASVHKRRLFRGHPDYQTIVKGELTPDMAKYWLVVSKINDSIRNVYKKVQRRYDYDLIGENGYIVDKDGKAVEEVTDITDLVIKELEK